jgi:hypothetical protein
MCSVKRRLFNVLAGTSLALCVMTAVFWVRSYFSLDTIFVPTLIPVASRMIVLESGCGFLLVGTQYYPSALRSNWGFGAGKPYPLTGAWMSDRQTFYLFGVRIVRLHDKAANNQTNWGVFTPCWLATVTTMLLPAIKLRQKYTRRNRSRGLCPHCGYDLRATPERCPECGSPAQPNPAGKGKSGSQLSHQS